MDNNAGMSTKDLLQKFATKERDFRNREFLAPYTPASKTAIVKMLGANYPFRVLGCKGHGIGIFRPVDRSCAKLVRDADFAEMRAYLDMLPKVNLILCYESDQGWIAYPMNLESSKKGLGLDSEIIVKNVTDCERFDVVTVRYDGAHFWFDEMFVGGDPIKSEQMRDCFLPNSMAQKMRMALGTLKSLTPEDRKSFDLALISWNLFQKVSTEDRIKKTFDGTGGHLGRYVLRGKNIEIRWKSSSGQEYTSLVKKDSLDVVSAGICLDPHDGTGSQDSKFHLKDLPFIIEQGEKRKEIVKRGLARGYDMGGNLDAEEEDY